MLITLDLDIDLKSKEFRDWFDTIDKDNNKSITKVINVMSFFVGLIFSLNRNTLS